MQYPLKDLVAELERQRANSRDIIADSREICADPAANKLDIELRIPFPDRPTEQYPLTEYAHKQLAEKCGIPWVYYDRMRKDGYHRLLVDNINTYIYEEKNRLVRILDGNVRAILASNYRIMDNYDLVFNALDVLKKHQIQILRCDMTETFLYMKVYKQDMVLELQSLGRMYSVIPALVLSNSEVGAARIKVEPSLVNPSCKNVFIGEAQFAKVHLGKRHDVGEIWKRDTVEAQDKALWLEVRDTIDAGFDPTVIDRTVKRLEEGASNPVVSPTHAVNAIAAQYVLSDKRRDELLDYFIQEAPTQFGLANALARQAQNYENADDQVGFERAAFELSSLPAKQFNKVLEKGVVVEVA